MASRGSGSRQKGANFERDIAKQLADKFGIDVKRTGSQERWSYYGGDVHAPQGSETILNDFFFELKNRENLPKTPLDWYKKAKDDAEGSFKKPLVVMTKNHEDVYAMLTFDHLIAILKELDGYRQEDMLE